MMVSFDVSIRQPVTNSEIAVVIRFEQIPPLKGEASGSSSSGRIILQVEGWLTALDRVRSITSILRFWDEVGHNVADRAAEVYYAQKTR